MPVKVGSLTTWSKINFAESFAVARKTDGTLWSWGKNENGGLGLNISDLSFRSSPVQIGGATDWSDFSIGPDALHVLAIRNGGQLWAWGYNAFGQVGQENTSNYSSPVQVGALTNWAYIKTTERASFAIKTDGTLWAWGWNGWGQLGQNDRISKSSPVQIGALTTWASIFTGENHAFFVKTDGTLWSIGENGAGELGLNDVASRSSPTQIGSDTDWSDGTGNREATLALKTDNTLWAWGNDAFGVLGNNTSGSPSANVSSPTQIGSDTNWYKVGMTGAYGFMATTKG